MGICDFFYKGGNVLAVILIVEDNPQLLFSIEDAIMKGIQDENIKIKTATKGKSALEIANEISIDVFIIDINLPDSNGVKIAKEIRKKYKHHPIIIESSNTDSEYRNEIHEMIENIAYLTKPFSPAILINKVRNALDLSKKLNAKNLRMEEHGKVFLYQVEDIVYIEKIKNSKKINIVWADDTVLTKDEFKGAINSIKEKVGNDLVQVHKSFLINPKFIRKIDYIDSEIWLKYMYTSIPIGTTFREQLKYLL